MSQPYDSERAAEIRSGLQNATQPQSNLQNAAQPTTLSTLITSISIALWTSESIVDRLDSLLSGLVSTEAEGQPTRAQNGLVADAQAVLDRLQKLNQNIARIENMISPNPGQLGVQSNNETFYIPKSTATPIFTNLR